ncbi:FecR family protein [Thauera linaloolentis]|uniref:Anti-FecI sigma factor FecR n=1 Tax=Thauera linaloolentis (strain DSM 12138 / JCM 21573 / CCUG 41526 / CIP 105981 / IAM 15112 / NBRC 102519 / 47Lol) TaxID=1123367 RepID=N6Z8H5_THAL4|nr:FecR family protein [Thauera linaloolentis]ENO90663.1 anti-FecI sigma factor FecR [Thauera linaloolentis 47Lol = DSM 12138]MCM8565571.1 FecR family protein [Thauera linaloolentis]
MTPPATADSAIDWLVILHSGEVSAEEQQAFQRWLAADPRHHEDWARLTGSLDTAFGGVRQFNRRNPGQADTIAHALNSAETKGKQRRRLLRGGLAIAGIGAGTALLAQRHTPLTSLTADLRTATAERRRHTLEDGSVLTLNARSAADIDYRADARHIHLRQGALIADVAGGPPQAAARPFIVHTRNGSVRALGTRFLVHQQDGRSFVSVLRHHVELRTPRGSPATLAQGQAAWIDAAGIITPAAAPALSASAWERGLLEVHDAPLVEVIEQLRPYRHGFIRLAPGAAHLRVFGTYSLDDTDQALASLAQTLPITIATHGGGWLVRIEAQPA